VGRLWSGVWLSASFQIFALTAGENGLGGQGNCRGGGMSGCEYVTGGVVLYLLSESLMGHF